MRSNLQFLDWRLCLKEEGYMPGLQWMWRRMWSQMDVGSLTRLGGAYERARATCNRSRAFRLRCTPRPPMLQPLLSLDPSNCDAQPPMLQATASAPPASRTTLPRCSAAARRWHARSGEEAPQSSAQPGPTGQPCSQLSALRDCTLPPYLKNLARHEAQHQLPRCRPASGPPCFIPPEV